MIAAGVTAMPSATGGIVIPHGLTDQFGHALAPTTFICVFGSAVADGFAAVTTNRGCVGLGIAGFAEDGVTLTQWSVSSAYYAGGGDQIGQVTSQSDVVDVYYGFGTHALVARVTSMDSTNVHLNITTALANARLYWIVTDDIGAVVTLGGTGLERTVTLGTEAQGFIIGLAEQASTSINGTQSVAFGGANTSHGDEYGGNGEAWASAQTARWWNGPTGAGQTGGNNLVQEFENVSFAGGVSLLGGWIEESGTRPPTGITFKQHLLDLDATGAAWAFTLPSKGQLIATNPAAATVDTALRFRGTYAITLGAQALGSGHWGNAYGLSVPSLAFDVCMGASQKSDGTVLHFRDPLRSWYAGWDHDGVGSPVTRGTIQFPGKIHRAVRTDSGAGGLFNSLVVGQVLKGWVPQITRF